MKQDGSPALNHTYFPTVLYVVLVAAVYSFSLNNGFVFDDRTYLVDNPLVKNFDSQGIQAIFLSFSSWDYLPVTLLSFCIEYALFGMEPTGYHVTNTLLHLINVLLLHGVILRISGCRVTAFWTALLFAVHPVHVESVAWISERKNVLSMLFLLLSFRSYLLGRSRIPSILLFLFACLSKTSVVIFPLLLILLDHCLVNKNFKQNMMSKLPYFLISMTVVAITLMTHSQGGTLRPHAEGSPYVTFLSMLVVFKEYLVKLLFPINLNIWYPNPVHQSLFQVEVLKALGVVTLFVYFLRTFRKDRMIFFGLVWYLIALLPVSHIIPFPQMMADRFLYIPSIGLFLAVVAGFKRASQDSWKFASHMPVLVAAIVILNYVVLSHHRAFVYKDDFTLWSDSVRRSADNTIAMMYLGLTYWGHGDTDMALEKLARAREIEPKNLRAAIYTARIYEEKKETRKAEQTYIDLIRQAPDNPGPYQHLAVLYGNSGKPGKAILLLEKALLINPNFGLAHFNLGIFLYQTGEIQKSLEAHQKAVILEPLNAGFQHQLGMFYLKNTDRQDLARTHLQTSLRLNPHGKDADRIRVLLKKQL
jgi:Tfp pilus assembly protein PilF